MQITYDQKNNKYLHMKIKTWLQNNNCQCSDNSYFIKSKNLGQRPTDLNQ